MNIQMFWLSILLVLYYCAHLMAQMLGRYSSRGYFVVYVVLLFLLNKGWVFKVQFDTDTLPLC